MRRLFGIVGVIAVGSLTLQVFAHEVCVEKATGKLLEYQSSGTPGTCLANQIKAGIDPSTVDDKQVSLTEWLVIKKQWIDDPVAVEMADKESKRKSKEAKIEAKLGISPSEFQDLKDSLSR